MAATLYVGNSLEWEQVGYPPSDGWTVTLFLRLLTGGTPVTITATWTSDRWTMRLTAAQSAALAPGEYGWQITAGRGTENHTLSIDTLQILPSPAGTGDTRSKIKQTLDALDDLILGRASRDAQQITIAGTAITKMAPADILLWRDRYERMYTEEQAQITGRKSPRQIRVAL